MRAQLQTNMDPDLRGWIEWKNENTVKKKEKKIRVSPYKLVYANMPVSSYARKFNRAILAQEISDSFTKHVHYQNDVLLVNVMKEASNFYLQIFIITQNFLISI